MEELFIEEIRTKTEKKSVSYNYLASFWDIEHEICVRKIRLDRQLEIGKIYAFNYVSHNDNDTYHYVVLKIEDNNVYYIAEYYDRLISTKENFLMENEWEKCNVNEQLGINLTNYEVCEVGISSL